MIKKIFLFLFISLISLTTFADGHVEMADELRSSGKIYVVVAVITVLFIGLFIYLFSIDRKISKIEKDK
ncbi:CcmD family protein [Pseudopedobacter beijingensis]|uniref:CcmD family protein n=1 Tax=Pseudopedobacter beijingensis TaxID=1207056 RepID=A0ABW4IFA0_9SPHI